jgi:hypothetical protein
VVERMAVVMAEIHGQVLNWQIEEHARRVSRPRVMSRGQRNSVRRAVMVAPVGHLNHSPIDNFAYFSYNFFDSGDRGTRCDPGQLISAPLGSLNL